MLELVILHYFMEILYIFNKKKCNILNGMQYTKNKIFNNDEYKLWVNEIIANKKTNEKGRYEHGIYSNQMIYAYFITKILFHIKILYQINSFLTKNNMQNRYNLYYVCKVIEELYIIVSKLLFQIVLVLFL